MDFFIQAAIAQTGTPPQANIWASLIPLVVLFLVFYFLLIRPQTKRLKEHKQMLDALAKGDEVVTNGGLLGRVTDFGDNFVVLEIATNTEIKIQKQAISAVMPKGTLKTL